jgi:hypothetical protein
MSRQTQTDRQHSIAFFSVRALHRASHHCLSAKKTLTSQQGLVWCCCCYRLFHLILLVQVQARYYIGTVSIQCAIRSVERVSFERVLFERRRAFFPAKPAKKKTLRSKIAACRKHTRSNESPAFKSRIQFRPQKKVWKSRVWKASQEKRSARYIEPIVFQRNDLHARRETLPVSLAACY